MSKTELIFLFPNWHHSQCCLSQLVPPSNPQLLSPSLHPTGYWTQVSSVSFSLAIPTAKATKFMCLMPLLVLSNSLSHLKFVVYSSKIFINSMYLKNVNTTNLINSFLMPKPLNDEDKNNVKIANIKRFLIIPTQKSQTFCPSNKCWDGWNSSWNQDCQEKNQ